MYMQGRLTYFTALFLSFILISTLICCDNEVVADEINNDDTPPIASNVNDLLNSFYNENGGKDTFPSNQVLALEALIFAQQDIEAGNLAQAKERIDSVFNEMPFSNPVWWNISSNTHCSSCSMNIGSPTAYYGLRMLDQILALENPEKSESLTMTVVVAPCAEVRRPTLPNLSPEVVDLNIAPKILAEDGRLLHVSTALFRKWVQAITGGLKVNLEIYTLDECTTVDFNVNGNIITSYPDAQSMIDAVPSNIADETDFWWVVAPSGVPGDGSGFNKYFITGGMGVYGQGLPLFLSDDAWFTRKPEHMGSGPYHEIEVMAYQPQWFQHEFMHHLYRKWPEFRLEVSGHQWFNRTTWPADFEGEWEPDYYTESINKRFLNAIPPLAEGLKAVEPLDLEGVDPMILVGQYQRQPVQNQWHEVNIVIEDGELNWQNAAGVRWSLSIINGTLWTGADCPYGEQKLFVVSSGVQNEILSVRFNGESYVKIG